MSDFTLIGPEHVQLIVKTITVVRKPTETTAFFLDSGQYKVITANGEAFCEGPVWILIDPSGYPYPVMPEEFEKTYVRKD